MKKLIMPICVLLMSITVFIMSLIQHRNARAMLAQAEARMEKAVNK